jgi:hypothetical protein
MAKKIIRNIENYSPRTQHNIEGKLALPVLVADITRETVLDIHSPGS